MSDAMKVTAAARGVCLTPGYAMAVGAFDPFAAAAESRPWKTVETWNHRVDGACEALLSLRFAVSSRLSEASVQASDALSESALRSGHLAPGTGLLRARVCVTRKGHASKTFLVDSGGIDVFGARLRLSVLAPPSMRPSEGAQQTVEAAGFGALEEAWSPLLGEEGASLRPKATVHTYCAKGVPAAVPPSATRYEVIGACQMEVRLLAGGVAVSAAATGSVSGYRAIELDRNAVVAWEVAP